MGLFKKKKSTEPKIGDSIKLANSETIIIDSVLGEGGQGIVYKVRSGNKFFAFKWYHKNAIHQPDIFYKNLCRNIKNGPPSKDFLWPIAVTENKDGRFGYLMELRPPEYRCFSEFLCARVRFKSIDSVVNSALSIVSSFRKLHKDGYTYQDLNDGNFFINPNDGSILICDNDNVSPYSFNLGIAGKVRYMAPEVARNIVKPDNYSDRFSLAVILFELLFLSHPLEGRKTLVPCMTEELEHKFFAKEPLFVYDTDDDSNRPDEHVHLNVINLWKIYPKFIKKDFIASFSRVAMDSDNLDKMHNARLMDNQWLIDFINLRASIVRCVCGEEIFLNSDVVSKCYNCGADIPKQHILTIGKYFIVMFPHIKLYSCHIDSNSDDFRTVKGEITRHPEKPSLWGLKNLDDKPWIINCKDGLATELAPGKNIQIGKIDNIQFNSWTKGSVL